MPKCLNCFPGGYDWKGKGNIALPDDTLFPEDQLPAADFLVLTWTKEETHALTKVLGAGKYHFETGTKNNLTPITFPGIETPANPKDGKSHGFYFKVKIGNKTIVCLKCNMHPKQPADRRPFSDLLKKMIESGGYKYLVTAGTAGGVWPELDLGDVVISNHARWGLTMDPHMLEDSILKGLADIKGGKAESFETWYDYANHHLLTDKSVHSELNKGKIGRQKKSAPTIYYHSVNGHDQISVITNDKIGKDHNGNDLEYVHLTEYRKCGATLDENDAFIAKACESIQFKNWVSIRNVSDLPQDESAGDSSDDQYDLYGHCSSINGAFAVWAFINGH